MSAPLFAFQDVTVAGDERPRLDRLSAEIAPEGVTAIVGPSGSGKSTLLRCCDRLEAPDAGVVRYRGDDLAARDPLALRREVGMVFQQPVLFPGTIADNVLTADPQADGERIAALLARAGLDPGFAKRDADALSGGEAQRACLARALATDPRVLLMDEPTSALDATATVALEGLVRSLADDGIPVLLVTHDLAQMRRVADRLVVLADGRVAQAGPAADVLAAPGPALAALLAEAA